MPRCNEELNRDLDHGVDIYLYNSTREARIADIKLHRLDCRAGRKLDKAERVNRGEPSLLNIRD